MTVIKLITLYWQTDWKMRPQKVSPMVQRVAASVNSMIWTWADVEAEVEMGFSSKGIPVSVWIPSHVEWIHANEVWIPSTLEWIHTQIASQTSELRCKNSFKKSHFLITISPQKNFLSNVILSCSRTDLVKYMHWLRMNSYHIGMNSFLIRMDSFRSRKQVCKNAFKVI